MLSEGNEYIYTSRIFCSRAQEQELTSDSYWENTGNNIRKKGIH